PRRYPPRRVIPPDACRGALETRSLFPVLFGRCSTHSPLGGGPGEQPLPSDSVSSGTMSDVERLPSPCPTINPRRNRRRISPQPFLRLSGFLLQPFKYRISRRILPIPPAPAVFDHHVIEIHATG